MDSRARHEVPLKQLERLLRVGGAPVGQHDDVRRGPRPQREQARRGAEALGVEGAAHAADGHGAQRELQAVGINGFGNDLRTLAEDRAREGVQRPRLRVAHGELRRAPERRVQPRGLPARGLRVIGLHVLGAHAARGVQQEHHVARLPGGLGGARPLPAGVRRQGREPVEVAVAVLALRPAGGRERGSGAAGPRLLAQGLALDVVDKARHEEQRRQLPGAPIGPGGLVEPRSEEPRHCC
mmetsp:Transcript_131243/g.356341  ORF Transcript_131243/g.356341 Transcript_131243/m.356341 type:complete len:239 (+) Transcript_131243:641-1357(+)